MIRALRIILILPVLFCLGGWDIYLERPERIVLGSLFKGSARDTMGASPTLVGNASVATGALVLDGTGDRVTYPDSSMYSFPPSGPFTVVVWFKPSVVSATDYALVAKQGEWAVLFKRGLSPVVGPQLVKYNSGGASGVSWGMSTTPIAAGSTYCLIIAQGSTAGDVVLYLNGVAQAITSRTFVTTFTAMADSSSALSIGSEYAGSDRYPFNGIIYQTMIYNYKFSAADATRTYVAGYARQAQGGTP